MRPPDYCSSICCNHAASHDAEYCVKGCSHALWFGQATIKGRTWRWEYDQRFGPLFLTKDGYPLMNQPDEGHPVWKAFAKWEKGLKG